MIAVHDALEELASFDLRLVRVVEMRYFVSLENGDVARALGSAGRMWAGPEDAASPVSCVPRVAWAWVWGGAGLGDGWATSAEVRANEADERRLCLTAQRAYGKQERGVVVHASHYHLDVPGKQELDNGPEGDVHVQLGPVEAVDISFRCRGAGYSHAALRWSMKNQSAPRALRRT